MSPTPASNVSTADLLIYQGDDYSAGVQVLDDDGLPLDLSGYTAQAQIRRNVADRDPLVVVEIQCSIDILDPSRVVLFIPHEDTKPLTNRYRWDLQIVDGWGIVTTILYGNVYVQPEVTRQSLAAAAAINRSTAA